jgi:hypothetical protein
MTTDAAWRAGLQAVNDEAAGLLDVSIIDALAGAEFVGECSFRRS